MKQETLIKANELNNEIKTLRDWKEQASKCSEMKICHNSNNILEFGDYQSRFRFSGFNKLDKMPHESKINEILEEEIQDCLRSIARRLEKELIKAERELDKL